MQGLDLQRDQMLDGIVAKKKLLTDASMYALKYQYMYPRESSNTDCSSVSDRLHPW